MTPSEPPAASPLPSTEPASNAAGVPEAPSDVVALAMALAARRARALGDQLLVYTPEGPLGGTFTCAVCAASAWQPDRLSHAASCPHFAVGR
jgi:hypothetical protein